MSSTARDGGTAADKQTEHLSSADGDSVDTSKNRGADEEPRQSETITVSYYALPWYKRPIFLLVPVWLLGVAVIIYFTQFFSRVEEALVGSGVLEYLTARQSETDTDLVAIAKENGIEGLDTYMFLDAHYGHIVWGTIAALLVLTVLFFIWDSIVVRRHEVKETSRQLNERIAAEREEAEDDEDTVTGEPTTSEAPLAFASQKVSAPRRSARAEMTREL